MSVKGFEDIEDEFRDYARRVMVDVTECMRQAVYNDAPYDTGQLRDSIVEEPAATSAVYLSALVQQQSEAAYGSFLDRTAGNKHQGWWSKYPFDDLYDRCLQASAETI